MIGCAVLLLLLGLPAPGDEAASGVGQEIERNLAGKWAGYLEYRDYAEPAGSTKRVQLPTWLEVTRESGRLKLHYVYDDGPGKVIEETVQVAIDSSERTYRTFEAGTTFRGTGFETLKNGRGTLILLGTGTEDDQPAELRMTLTVRRNLCEWLLESRPRGSQEAFAFRHLYRMTRAEPPATSAPGGK